MTKNTDEIIFEDDPKAAEFRTDISGWVSRKGVFYGNSLQAEKIARYEGATHRLCKECNNPAPISQLRCDVCQEKRDRWNYLQLPVAPYDDGYIYSQVLDRYFDDPQEVIDELDSLDGKNLDDLRLVLCVPEYATLAEDYFVDLLAEEMDFPDELYDAIEEFNNVMSHTPLSYRPGEVRVDLSLEPWLGVGTLDLFDN